MASRCTIAALLLGAASAQTSRPSIYWTVTSRFVLSISSSLHTYSDGEVTMWKDSEYRTVKPTVTPTASPYSTTTYTRTYEGVAIVSAFYSASAVAESDLVPDPYTQTGAMPTSTQAITYSEYEFYMPVTLTAPASCPTPFTVTSTAFVDIPTEIYDQLKPTSTISATLSTNRYGDVYDYKTLFLTPGAAPFDTATDLYYSDYIAMCSKPPTGSFSSSPGSGSNSTNSNNNNDDNNNYRGDYCFTYHGYGCGMGWATYVIILASVIPGLFILGFLESWFWFRRLMLGKACLRFGTVCWVMISLWILCFTRTQGSRSKEDQVLLRENWKKMGSGAAFKAWWKWGFRHRYPEPLLGQFSPQTIGIVPLNQPLTTNMVQPNTAFLYPSTAAPGQFHAPPPTGPQAGVFYGPKPEGWLPGPTGGFVPSTGFLQAPLPAQPGIYYGPQPAGWTLDPNGTGGFLPLSGNVYPFNAGIPQQHTGYYGSVAPEKGGSVDSTPPGSALGYPGQTEGVVHMRGGAMGGGNGMQQQHQQPTISPLTMPQQAHMTPQTATSTAAPQIPPIHVSEAPLGTDELYE